MDFNDTFMKEHKIFHTLTTFCTLISQKTINYHLQIGNLIILLYNTMVLTFNK